MSRINKMILESLQSKFIDITENELEAAVEAVKVCLESIGADFTVDVNSIDPAEDKIIVADFDVVSDLDSEDMKNEMVAVIDDINSCIEAVGISVVEGPINEYGYRITLERVPNRFGW